MRRLLSVLILLMITMPLLAQPPVSTPGGNDGPPFGEGPPQDESFPPGFPGAGEAPPGGEAQVVPNQPATTPEPTAPPPGGEAAVTTPEPTESVPEVDPNLEIILNARLDLERLADATLGSDRPEGWNGTLDVENPQLAALVRLDLELLAGTLLGADTRPEGWFGFVNSTPYAFARDVRHDLELLADQFERPADWAGAEPLLRCDRATQAMVQFLESNGVFTLQADRTAPDFCEQAAREASTFVEVNLLSNPSANGDIAVLSLGGSASVNSPYAASFLDRSAVQRAGVIPEGTAIEPVARSYAQFSKMMFVRGDGFAVFVDYQFTDVTDEQFDALPDINAQEVNPICTADWCENG